MPKPGFDSQEREGMMGSDFLVGGWHVAPRLDTLTRGSKSVRVEPKAMQVLVLLASRRGEVLSKEEIIGQVWSGTFVTDEVLWRCISILRTVLGDDDRTPKFIQTIPKRGYRLIAEVAGTVAECEARVAEESDGSIPAELVSSIAVVPFVDLSPGNELEHFCDGITEEVINSLTHVKGLRVAARDSAYRFRRRDDDIRTVGKHLGVRAVLSGSVRKFGNRCRVTVQLMCARDGCNIWSQQYEFGLGDPFAAHDEISRAVVKKLRPGRLAFRAADA